LSKETYVALGKAAAIVYKLGLHDTLRDLKVAKTRFQTFLPGNRVLFKWKCQIRRKNRNSRNTSYLVRPSYVALVRPSYMYFFFRND